MVTKHSERGKDATTKQVNSIIKFLEKQVANYEKELIKYTEKKYITAIQGNYSSTKKSLEYYLKLKAEYIEAGYM